MREAREITGAIFTALEIVHGAVSAYITDWSNMFQQPDVAISLIQNASIIAFIAFAAAAFRRFSYRWLRVIGAFLALILLPFAALLIFGRYGSYVLPVDWFVRLLPLLPAINQIILHSMQLGVAGFIYFWSVRRERCSVVAASAELAT